MKRINLINDWELSYNGETRKVNLPYDWQNGQGRDFVYAKKANGFFHSSSGEFSLTLPKFAKGERVYLEISGVSKFADVFINDQYADSIVDGHIVKFIDVTDLARAESTNTVRLAVNAPTQSGANYIGGGICGHVDMLVYDSMIALLPNGVSLTTAKVTDKGAHLVSKFSVENRTSERKFVYINLQIFNANGTRVCNKMKKVKCFENVTREFEMPARVRRLKVWSLATPYIYKVVASIIDDGKVIDSTEFSYGIRSSELEGKALLMNEKVLKIKGATVPHDNGIIGNISDYHAEMRRFGKLKEAGFEAVHFIGMPSRAVLDAVDASGLILVADIFEVWNTSSYSNDSHVYFRQNYKQLVADAVKMLRNRPSVLFYSLGNNIAEAHSPSGAKLIAEMVEIVKSLDSTRPIMCSTGNTTELTDKDYFKIETASFFDKLDICGYNNLESRFGSDKVSFSKRVLLSMSSDKPLDAWSETDKNSNVVGDFSPIGIDFLGNGKGEDEVINTSGDLDILAERKVESYARQISYGYKHIAIIASVINGQLENIWKGTPNQLINVEVISSGDVIALSLNGKQIGRKVAGKLNGYRVSFEVPYEDGVLEAISYFKGAPVHTAVLSSSMPAIKIKAQAQRFSSHMNQLMFVDAAAVDAEGKTDFFFDSEFSVVVQNGEIVACGNANPADVSNVTDNIANFYKGKALIVVRPSGLGRVTVRVYPKTKGIRRGRARFNVK